MKYKLGDLIIQSDERNSELSYSINNVKGISIKKEFIETKAKMDGVSLRPYKVVPPGYFAYVTVTSRNSEKITLAYNDTDKTYIVSSSYIVFEVDKKNILLPEYLFMFFNRPEFDRLARFNSWGSARETFTWEDMCDLKIIIPPIDVQRKYVSLYKALLNNQQTYETGLNDLKLLCDMYIEQLQKTEKAVEIGKYIEPFDERNTVGLTKNDVRGISTSKEIIPTKAKLEGVKLDNYKLFYPNQIAFVPDTSRRGEKISLALNNSENTYLVSSITTIFSTDPNKLLSSYLMLFFQRPEFDRYARFNSWGSAREVFSWEDMKDVKIPIPNLEIQNSIIKIYNAYFKRREIAERLKEKINSICPVLIKGSIVEAKEYEKI